MKFEKIKIFRKKSILGILIFFSILIILSSLFKVMLYEYDYVEFEPDLKFMTYKGLSAIEKEREVYANCPETLDVNYLNSAFQQIMLWKDGDERNLKISDKYPWLTTFYFKGAFRNSDDIYGIRNGQVNERIGKLGISNEKKSILIQKNSEIQIPFTSGWSKGFENWIGIGGFIFAFLVAFMIILIDSQIFSEDRENNMDQILVTLNKKSVKNIAVNKIKLISFAFMKFVVIAIVLSLGIMLIFYGISGGGASIQTFHSYYFSLYSYSFLKLTLWLIISVFVSLMAINAIVLLINIIVKNRFLTLILSTIAIFSPLLLGNITLFPESIANLINLSPINGLLFESLINKLYVYNFFGISIMPLQAICFASLFVCLVIYPMLSTIFIRTLKKK